MYQLLGGDKDTLCADCMPDWHDVQVKRGCCAYPYTIFHVRPNEKGGGTFGLRRKTRESKPDMSVLQDNGDGEFVAPEALDYVEKRVRDVLRAVRGLDSIGENSSPR